LPISPLTNQSIPAGSTAVATGGVCDNGVARTVHTAICTSTAGISAGAFNLQVSQDNVNWFSVGAPQTVVANSVQVLTYTGGAFQYLRAAITTTVVGGTIGITVTSGA